ncbi:hypothetical protein AVO42_03640 [Thiomicrospira sp. XS5]|nr:hypothetical protein AVO42_03640 [Thiomicrospira sp. XS5]
MLAFFIGARASISRLGAFHPQDLLKNLKARFVRAFLCLTFRRGYQRIGQAWRFCLKGRYALKAKMLKYLPCHFVTK